MWKIQYSLTYFYPGRSFGAKNLFSADLPAVLIFLIQNVYIYEGPCAIILGSRSSKACQVQGQKKSMLWIQFYIFCSIISFWFGSRFLGLLKKNSNHGIIIETCLRDGLSSVGDVVCVFSAAQSRSRFILDFSEIRKLAEASDNRPKKVWKK